MRITIGAAMLLVILAAAPQASAGLTMTGAHYTSGNLDLAFATNVSNSVSFTSTGLLVLDGVTIDLQASSPAGWTLTHWAPGARIIFNGTPTGTGSLRVDGLSGVWRLTGANGLPAVDFQGTGGPAFPLVSGTQVITLEKQTSRTMIQDVEGAIGDGFSSLLFLIFAAMVLLAIGAISRLRASPSHVTVHHPSQR